MEAKASAENDYNDVRARLRFGMTKVVAIFLCAFALALSPSASWPSVRAGDPVKGPVAQAPATRPAQTQWLDRVAEFFRQRLVSIALITIGVIGLIFEFKFPGTTFPGSVAAICFVLFFWC